MNNVMSYCDNVKSEIINKEIKKDCCIHAFMYGFLLGNNAFFCDFANIKSKNIDIIKLCYDYISQLFYLPEIESNEKKDKYIIKINNQTNIQHLHKHFFHNGNKKIFINLKNMKNTCCMCSFLKGLFVACGYITDPKKYYRLEFNVHYRELGENILKVINNVDELDITARLSKRKNSHIIYIKDNNQICDILAYLGARNSAMQFIQNNMLKDVRNYVNRTTNFEAANICKTATAAAKQIKAINIIKNKKGLSFLNDDLRELAQLRLDNPQLSLSELNKKLKKPLSKSGLTHRLNKLIAISKE